ncbi:hypothetical protein Tco_0017193 [Tanacetum coccineum]
MVACLEKSDENVEFHQIVDFLTTSSIHYALTVSPTIYAFYIEQFWATAKSKTVNVVKQIHATVDGKTVVISKSLVRSDLHFNDEDVTTVATQYQKTHKPRRAKRGRDTKIPHSSGTPKKFGDEAVYTGEDDRVVRAATTTSSLEAEQESDKYVADILKKFDFATVKTTSTPIETNKALLKDEEAEDVDVHLYRSMIRSLMYLTASRPDIMFAVCACARFQVTPKVSHLHAVKRIFKYLKGQPKLGLWQRVACGVLSEESDGWVIDKIGDGEDFLRCKAGKARRTTFCRACCGGGLPAAGNLEGEERGDRPRCQEAMGGVIAQTRSERASKHSYDSPLPVGNTPGSDEERLEQDDLTDFVPPTPYDLPLSGGHTPGSDKGRPNITELIAICTNLSNRVLALEQSKTAQDLVIRKLKKKVRKLEKKLRARTLGLNLFKIGTSKRKRLDKENVSKQGRKSDKTKPMFDDSDFAELDIENVEGNVETQGRNTAEQITTVGDTVNTASIDVSVAGPSNVSTTNPSTSTAGDIFEDEMMAIADTLMAIRSTRPRTTSVVIRDVKEEPREQH